MKEKELERIRDLSLEEQAQEEEKSAPGILLATIFLLGLGLGLYYWFGNNFIFNYEKISPFWGFAIFIAAGIIIDLIISAIYDFYWKDYNEVINSSNKKIEEIIKKGEADPATLDFYKKINIERKIGKELLSSEEFAWHTSRYCWGCGNKHIQQPIYYKVEKERTESWKETPYRYTKTFRKESKIPICPDCYSRLQEAKEKDENNTLYYILIMIFLAILALIAAYAIWGGTGALICFFGILIGGFYVLMLLAHLILSPFIDKGDNRTKWDFDEIPEIKKFLNMKLPHDH